MGRVGLTLRVGLLALLAVVLATALAIGPARASDGTMRPSEVGLIDVFGQTLSPDAILAGEYDRQMLPVPVPLRLQGGTDREYWMRIVLTLPPWDTREASRYLLQFDRVDVELVTVYMRDDAGNWRSATDGFYAPAVDPHALRHSYSFEFPPRVGGPQVAYVQVVGLNRMLLDPRIVEARAAASADHDIGIWLSAIYASVFMLMLSALALFVALRDRVYLHFVALCAVLLLLLAAMNGHLYRLPGGHWFAWWRGNGVHLLAIAAAGLAIGFTQNFLELGREQPALARLCNRVRIGVFTLAALCLLDLRGLVPQVQNLAALVALGSAIFICWLSFSAWKRGQRLARAHSLVWTAGVLAVATRVAMSLGWIPPRADALYVAQAFVVVMLFLLSIGLSDRVMEFRRQRDRARQAKEQTDADLQVEQARREFIEALHEQTRDTAPGGDLEWRAFKRVLGSLHGLVPQLSSAVIAFGYHDLDLLISEPLESKERYSRLLAARGGTLKGLCRSRNAVQATLDDRREGESGPGVEENVHFGHYAVVPIPMPLPGWGALLLERTPGEQFSAAELRLATDFLRQAVAALDEAASQADLKRKAELDALTGACNKRLGEALLGQALERAAKAREPLGVMMVDIDRLRAINDRHGHAVGDDCLRQTADVIRREIEAGDILVRQGPEEFVVILPGSAPEQARRVAEAIRQGVSRVRIGEGASMLRFTVSIGLTGRAGGEEEPGRVIERAERALIQSKRGGRNQVSVLQTQGYGMQQDAGPNVSL